MAALALGNRTLLRHLFLATIEHTDFIPSFVELRRANQLPSLSLIDILVLICREHHLDIAPAALKQLLRAGRFVIFLDGFDELRRDRAAAIALQINQFIEEHSSTRLVVTSRPDPNAFIGWSFFRELRVLPLTKEQCLELIGKLRYEPELKRLFTRAVEEHLFASYGSFLTNPLLATLLMMTFEQFGTIDEKRHIFYSQAFDTLLQRHDASKVGYRREIQSRLSADEFRALVSAFCIQSYLRSELVFTPDRARDLIARAAQMITLSKNLDTSAFLADMVMSVCLLIEDGVEFTFTHRALQEYFAASFLLSLSSEARKPLLDVLRLRLIADDVASLLFDMDPFTFEAEFLVPAVEELRRNCSIRSDWRPRDALTAMLRYSGGALSVSVYGLRIVRATHEALFYFDLCRFIVQKYQPRAPEDDTWPLKEAILRSRLKRGRSVAEINEDLRDGMLTTDDDLADERVSELLDSSELLSGIRMALALPEDVRRRHGARQKAIEALLDCRPRRL